MVDNQRSNEEMNPRKSDLFSAESKRQSMDAERSAESLNLDFKKIARGVCRHAWIVVLIAFIGACIGGYLSYRLARSYEANAVLVYQVERKDSRDNAFQIINLSLPSAVEMITLPVHLKAVISILGLDLSVEELQKMITVEMPTRDSNLINIKVKADNPNLAIDVANTLASVVVKSSQELNRRQWQQAYTYFANQEKNLKQQLDESIHQLAEFRQKHRFLGMDISSSASLYDVRSAEQQLEKAKLDFTKIQVEYENVKKEYEKIPDKIAQPTQKNQTLESQITQIENSLLLARTKFAPDNPKIKILENQLAEIKKQSTESEGQTDSTTKYVTNPIRAQLDLSLIDMQSKMLAAQKLQETLQERVTTLNKEIANLSEQQLNFAQMVNQKDFLETQIRVLEEKQRQAEILIHLGKGDIESYQSADKAFGEKSSVLIAVLPFAGLVFGAFFGFLLIFILEVTDSHIRTARQCELYLGIPCLATIPSIKGIRKRSGETKALYYTRTLAETIQSVHSNFKSLALTSSTTGEGKSFLIHYLAQYHTQMGKSVLILELDWRPNLFDSGVAQPKATLEDYLTGQCSIADMTAHGLVDRIKAGRSAELNKLLKSQEMQILWSALNSKYDLILIDTPGLVEEDALMSMLTFADLRLFVIGSSMVKRPIVESTLRELEFCGIDISEVILNQVLPIYLDNARVRVFERSSKSGVWERWTTNEKLAAKPIKVKIE